MNLADINLDLVRVIIMVSLIVAFLGMWAWAWSSKRKEVFHEASMLPLEEDNGQIPDQEERVTGGQGTVRQEKIEE